MYRMAFIEIYPDDCDERHLLMTRQDYGRDWFQERPGPGPQLADFGPYGLVLHLTKAEMNF
jgi:hypothetical protein